MLRRVVLSWHSPGGRHRGIGIVDATALLHPVAKHHRVLLLFGHLSVLVDMGNATETAVLVPLALCISGVESPVAPDIVRRVGTCPCFVLSGAADGEAARRLGLPERTVS